MSAARWMKPYGIGEADIMRAVRAYLKFDMAQPNGRVLFCERFNSGGCFDAAKQFIRFNTLPGCPDLIGMLRDGRFLAIECKHSRWKGPETERERVQAALLERIRAHNGAAGFVTSLADVEELIRGST